MKYLGIDYGWLTEEFVPWPNCGIRWMTLKDDSALYERRSKILQRSHPAQSCGIGINEGSGQYENKKARQNSSERACI